MHLEEIKKIIKTHLDRLKEQYGVEEIGVFGSCLENKVNKNDIDILIAFKKTIGLLKYIELENELSILLRYKVDLVMKDALKPHIGKNILSRVVYI